MNGGYLSVTAGGVRCGLPLDDVRSIVEIDAVRPAPSVHAAVLGVMAADEGFLPLVALARLVGGRTERRPDMAVVAQCGAALVALAVDDVDDVVEGEVQPVPKDWEQVWASAVARDGRGLVPLVDLTVVAAQLTPGEMEVHDAE